MAIRVALLVTQVLLCVSAVPQDADSYQLPDSMGLKNIDWDCSCPGILDVCDGKACTLDQYCTRSGTNYTMPNNQVAQKNDHDSAWHCNCPLGYSWCSYTVCFYQCNPPPPDVTILVASQTQATVKVGGAKIANNIEWDCPCDNDFDVCSADGKWCTFSTHCSVIDNNYTVPNKQVAHNDWHKWHCNCPLGYTWCSATTCFNECYPPTPNEPPQLEASQKQEIVVKAARDDIAKNSEWDCHCSGIFDVGDGKLCTYSKYCHGSGNNYTVPNKQVAQKNLHVWHCNCPIPYTWCSYTTCFYDCHPTSGGEAKFVVSKDEATTVSFALLV